MFENLGWSEVLIIIVAGLFILGPERLPGAIRWVGSSIRRVREYATGARNQLRGELGPEFEELREPLEQVRSLRAMGPRKAITKHLLDDYDPVEDARQYDVRSDLDVRQDFDVRSESRAPLPQAPVAQPRVQQPLGQGERPPFDPDAT
ncbi:Sec-independent protein translocase protein TatB [Sciscionella sediminilitoris]|uniref:Sec-independent protein translocase protein TatB n=1 Tax=Sciscionella sediminilitoris TaxID=1445613 RepID=UPI0004DF0F21|nr:Sec-independent protein translocase protein TatB [Sciscionella sp. SE31]